MADNYSRTWTNKLPLWLLKWVFNIYGPYFGAAIKVKSITPDFRQIEVMMKQRWYNTNYVGTHFGGSIYSMTDPFYMLMLIKNLGRNYIVWDKAAYIDFKKPGKGTLHSLFTFTDQEIQSIKLQVDKEGKYVFEKPVDVLNEENIVVASVIKTLYVKKK